MRGWEDGGGGGGGGGGRGNLYFWKKLRGLNDLKASREAFCPAREEGHSV